jgi:hypothetical protein
VLRQCGQEVRILPGNEEFLSREDAILPDGQFVGPLDGFGGDAVSPGDEGNGFAAAN